jgi:signal transduction histidine kinase
VWNRDFLHEIEGQTDSGLDILDPVAVPKPADSVNLLDFKVVTFKMLPGWNGSPAAYLRSSRVIDSAVQYRKASWEDQLIHIVIVFVFLIGVAMILIRIINRPVKNMVLSLLSEDPEPISRLRSQKTEFGQIARLMSEFFIQKKKLVREIEENLKIEKELTLAKDRAEESDRLKTTFLNNLSHEIRTPMNAIVGFSELIGDPDISEEEKKQFTGIIRDNTFRLLSTITDLVTLSKIETGQEPVIREEFNLNELLNGLFREIKEEINGKPVALNLIVPVENSSPNILTDRRKLITILRNLLVNSVKFTNSGKIDFGYSWQDGELRFFVRDTGIGIPAGKFEDIFARFQQADDSLTRQVGGAGLGLPISRAYAELLGGQMWVTSEVGKGSEFFFTIPFNSTVPN